MVRKIQIALQAATLFDDISSTADGIFLVNSIALFSPEIAPLGQLIAKVGKTEEISTRPSPF
ncbi:hypothetical protein [Mesorhizobium sp. M6A.T.Ce.TU.016.01.1.1]|uniref:hypothetical protein n=1 Tax=Mesorhizobium sp. M6A.T.Ce.TU.016.01.1.1 TaxID=2496783 RepID=UPI000FCA8D12|nr:hypothetical protein [Mesorhizobium sp. M6A.T.Ce.TU.016.01.1.1]RUU30759.1 hypothetical protein EOC94_07140 [Mesorhizobium sp. M6A.T.Ce.TU.016.01.1.1]